MSESVTALYAQTQVALAAYADLPLNPGDFGIRLKDAPVVPTPTYTFTGDFELLDNDPATPGIQPVDDGFGNAVRDPNLSSPGRADVFYDSPGSDEVRGEGGDDWIEAWRGGDDRLDGGGADNPFGDLASSAIPFDWAITPIRPTSLETCTV